MLYKDYFNPDSSWYLFFKVLLLKTHYPLALEPSTLPHKLPCLLAPSSGLLLPGYPGHLSFSRRCQSASFKSLISTDTPASLLRHLQFSSYGF